MADVYGSLMPNAGAAFGTATPQEQADIPPNILAKLVAAFGRSAAKFVAGPGELSQPNPYPEGSEGAYWYEDQRAKGMQDWSREAALNTMGTGAIAGVPLRAGEVALGSGMIRPGSMAPERNIFDAVSEKYPMAKIDGSHAPSGYATLGRIVVQPEARNQGLGTQIMNDLISEADKRGIPMALSPTSDFGGNKTRLQEFYKRFGFVPNAGRNKDFATRETMIRPAKK